MKTKSKAIGLTIVLTTLTGGMLFAQEFGSPESNGAIGSDKTRATDAPFVIFSNLVRGQGARYNTEGSATIAGKDAAETEQWYAVRFVPKVDVQAKVLSAAIGYSSGTKLVTLGIYSDNPTLSTVGDPLPGGQGSATKIPDLGECCELTTVRLPATGVTLSKDTAYWLVAGPDDVNGSNFQGGWQFSYLAVSAYLNPSETQWTVPSGAWLAAEIRGTQLPTLRPIQETNLAAVKMNAATNDVRIFTNLDHNSPYLYLPGAGVPINGNKVPLEGEALEALPFTPRADVHVKIIAAAVAWESGTKFVNLGIYSDTGGSPGSLLPGGRAGTSEIPDLGICCELTQVILPGAGVALSKNVQYWLVASADNVKAPDFAGVWQDSALALSAYEQPENFINWTTFSGSWLAAEIRGTSP